MPRTRDERTGPAVTRPSRTLESYARHYLERLNEVHVGTQLTLSSLEEGRRRASAKPGSAFHHFVVPTGDSAMARIRRGRRGVDAVFDRLLREGEYAKSLLMIVSITEDYVLNVLRLVLRAHPERLRVGWRGGPSDATVPIADVVERGWDAVLEERIEVRLHQALHASPADYLEFLRALLRIDVDGSAVAAFGEVKATRDVLVHAGGVANDVYVRKAQGLARAVPGDRLPLDRSYFDGCVTHAKRLVEGIHAKLCSGYADDERVRAAGARFLT